MTLIPALLAAKSSRPITAQEVLTADFAIVALQTPAKPTGFRSPAFTFIAAFAAGRVAGMAMLQTVHLPVLGRAFTRARFSEWRANWVCANHTRKHGTHIQGNENHAKLAITDHYQFSNNDQPKISKGQHKTFLSRTVPGAYRRTPTTAPTSNRDCPARRRFWCDHVSPGRWIAHHFREHSVEARDCPRMRPREVAQ